MPTTFVPTSGPTRPAVFVQRDSQKHFVRRRIRHACTLEEWKSPAHRAAKIAEAWSMTINTIGAEGLEFVTALPVTLYRDPTTSLVVVADIRTPGDPGPIWIDRYGTTILFPDTTGCIRENTTYMRWAEGPLPYMGDAPTAAKDPLDDRYLQYLRHQNCALREMIDNSMAGSRDAIPQDAKYNGTVDFVVRGAFLMKTPDVFESKQTNTESSVKLDGHMVEIGDLTQ